MLHGWSAAARGDGSSATVPVVARSKWLTGAAWTAADDEASAAARQRSRLLHLGPLTNIPPRLRDAIEAGEADGLHLRSHCRRRDVWWRLPEPPAPDAFLPYMMGTPKGVTANRSGAGCINGVHRVRWLPTICGDDYVLSTWTSLWALGMEQTCRHYAGGVLKLEPGKAPALPVVKVDDPTALARLDSTLRTRGIPTRAPLPTNVSSKESWASPSGSVRFFVSLRMISLLDGLPGPDVTLATPVTQTAGG